MGLIGLIGVAALGLALSACGGQAPPTSQGGNSGNDATGTPPASSSTSHGTVTDPPTFVLVSGAGMTSSMQLRSPVSGRIVRVLGTFGESFTNNGVVTRRSRGLRDLHRPEQPPDRAHLGR